MKDFFSIPQDRIICSNEYFFFIYDGYPVSPGHILIISKELRTDFFELTNEEKKQLPFSIEIAKNMIKENHSPDGFNIGMNCGESSGQTVFHFHCHVIPRYKGDIENPKGGVRGVIPSKMKY